MYPLEGFLSPRGSTQTLFATVFLSSVINNREYVAFIEIGIYTAYLLIFSFN